MLKTLFIIIILFSSLFIISCEDESIQPPIDEAIKIIQPINNSVVRDSATIIVQINNTKKIVRTEINIDHDTTIVFTKPPFTYLWNTTLYNDGSQHLVEASAYSSNSEVINAKPVIIYVSRFMPGNLSALLTSDTTIQLNWVDNSNFETGFEIEEAVGDSSFLNIAHVDSNITSYVIKGKYDDTTKYLFRIRAKSGTLLSGYSNIASTEIEMNPPSNIQVIFTSDTTAKIQWIDNNNFEDGYSVFSEEGNHISLLAKVSPNSTSANIKGFFLIGHFYGFKVAATYNEIISYSETIRKQFELNPPISLTIKSLSDRSIQLSWNSNNNFETGFVIERKTSSSNYSIIADTKNGQLNYTDDDLIITNSYTYRVSSQTVYNLSNPSGEININYTPYLSFNRQIKAPSAIASYSISNDNSIIVMGGYSYPGVVNYVLDFNNGNLLRILHPADSLDHMFLCTAISNDKSIALAGSYDVYTTLWNIDDGSLFKRLSTGTYTTRLLMSSLNKRLIASSEGKASFWDYEQGKLLKVIYTNDRINPDISINTGGNLLAFGENNDIKIVNTTDGNIISTLNSPGRNSNLIFYNNSSNLISIINNVIRICDLNTNSYTEYTSDGTWYESAIEANQKYLILYGNNVIGIWDLSKHSFVNLQTNINLYHIISLPEKNQFIGISGFYFNIYDFSYRWQIPLK